MIEGGEILVDRVRKEITRGIDELTEKLRLFERGEWCADREPILKAYAAGLADAEQQRQAQQTMRFEDPKIDQDDHHANRQPIADDGESPCITGIACEDQTAD